jgi:phytoene desaturase
MVCDVRVFGTGLANIVQVSTSKVPEGGSIIVKLKDQEVMAAGRTRKAVVVGAGIGGMATATMLARQGFKVRVIEKNAGPGGRCHRIDREGHSFDTGPTLFLMPEVYERAFAAMGERMSDHLDIVRNDPAYRLFMPDDRLLDFQADLARMKGDMERIEAGSHRRMNEYLAEGAKFYDLSMSRLLNRNYYSPLDFFNPRNFWLMLSLGTFRPHYRNASRYFRNPGLRAAFTFQNMYVGTSPFKSPSTFSLLAHAELGRGVWFPRGGMNSIVRALEGIARKNGVEFSFNTEVSRIPVSGGRASGVVLADGTTEESDVTVVNADLPLAYERLLPDQGPVRRLRRGKYTCSVINFYWGLDRQFPGLKHHNIILSREYEKSFLQIDRDKTLPDQPSMYINVANRTEEGFAPPGQDSMTAMVSVGHEDPAKPQDWEALKARARAAVFARMKDLGIGDIGAHIKFEMSYTPPEWRERYAIARGAVFGSLGHYPTQMCWLRPANRHSRYRNLYFVGGGTHPGCGVPLVLMSASLTAERVVRGEAEGGS